MMIHSIRTYRTTPSLRMKLRRTQQDERKNRFYLKIISSITASFLLAAPNIHAMAGYSFHFDKPKTESVRLDSYISSMLPSSMRLPQEQINRCDLARKVMGAEHKFTIVKRKTDPQIPFPAYTFNIGDRLSLVSFDTRISSLEIDAIRLHEFVHVASNHSGQRNLYYEIAPPATSAIATLSTLYAAMHKYCFGTSKKLVLGSSLLSALAYTYAQKQTNTIFKNYDEAGGYLKIVRSYEYEAEEKSIHKLPSVIGRKRTEQLLDINSYFVASAAITPNMQSFSNINPITGTRDTSTIYPTNHEYKRFHEQALGLTDQEATQRYQEIKEFYNYLCLFTELNTKDQITIMHKSFGIAEGRVDIYTLLENREKFIKAIQALELKNATLTKEYINFFQNKAAQMTLKETCEHQAELLTKDKINKLIKIADLFLMEAQKGRL